MNDELKRFFDSIKFSNDSFLGSEIKQVLFHKNDKRYEVIISSGKLILKEDVSSLIKACENKINGKDDCSIKMEYHDIPKDNKEEYLEDFVKSYYAANPSLGGITLTINDNSIIINCNSKMNAGVVKRSFATLTNLLEIYGFSGIEFDTNVNEEVLQKVKE